MKGGKGWTRAPRGTAPSFSQHLSDRALPPSFSLSLSLSLLFVCLSLSLSFSVSLCLSFCLCLPLSVPLSLSISLSAETYTTLTPSAHSRKPLCGDVHRDDVLCLRLLVWGPSQSFTLNPSGRKLRCGRTPRPSSPRKVSRGVDGRVGRAFSYGRGTPILR